MVVWLPAVVWALAGWVASTFFAPSRTQIDTQGGGVYGTPNVGGGTGGGGILGTGVDTNTIVILLLGYMLIKK